MALLVSDRILKEIERAHQRIDSRKIPSYVDFMHQNLARQAAENSSDMDKDNSDRSELVVTSFRDAWNYAIASSSSPLDPIFLQDVAGRLEPNNCVSGKKYAPFRSSMANLGIKDYLPPADKERILFNLDRLDQAIQNSPLHPVEESFLYALHLSRIQPFENGNKRLANIVMNVTLLNNEFCPISFGGSESQLYKEYLLEAFKGFDERSSKDDNHTNHIIYPEFKQRQFYEFLANKELRELRAIEDKLKGANNYVISFINPRDKGSMYTVKRVVHNWFSSHGQPSQVRINPSTHSLDIIGSIPQGTLENLLGKVKSLGKYEIKSNGFH